MCPWGLNLSQEVPHTCSALCGCVGHAVLQAGNWDSEGQQRLVSLTAQVTARAAQLAAAEERCNEALVGDVVGFELTRHVSTYSMLDFGPAFHCFVLF